MSLRLRADRIWRRPCRKPPSCIGACPTGAMRREPHGSLLDGHRRPHDNLPVGKSRPADGSNRHRCGTAAPRTHPAPRMGDRRAGLLTCGSRLRPAFPCPKAQWHIDRRSPLTVAGAVRELPRKAHPVPILSRSRGTTTLGFCDGAAPAVKAGRCSARAGRHPAALRKAQLPR